MSFGNRITVTGIVLSVKPINDYDRRITILTKERGKIAAFAKGARRTGNQLMASTQACVFGRFTLYEGKDSYNVSEVEVENFFSEMRSDVSLAYYSMYFCEIADFVTREGSDERAMLKLLYASFRALVKGVIDKRLIRTVFELKMTYAQGEGPLVSECVICHKAEENKYFVVSKRGAVCGACAERIPVAERISLCESSWYTLWYVANAPAEKLYSFKVTEEVLAEITKVAREYLSFTTNHEFSGAALIEMLG